MILLLSLMITTILLSSLIVTRSIVLPLDKELSDTVFISIRRYYDVNATICNANWPVTIVHSPYGGFANSFQALRGLIALALMINASVTSKYNSHISFVATWKPFCSLLDESLSCICRSSAIIASLT